MLPHDRNRINAAHALFTKRAAAHSRGHP